MSLSPSGCLPVRLRGGGAHDGAGTDAEGHPEGRQAQAQALGLAQGQTLLCKLLNHEFQQFIIQKTDIYILCTDLYFFAFQTLKFLGAEDERVQERRRPERRLLSGIKP